MAPTSQPAAGASVAAQQPAAIKTVVLDAQVLLKVQQHCNEAAPQMVSGQLLGLDVGMTLEITDCFPFTVGKEDVRYQRSETILF
jgi:translation initiation factor 3 subunit H